MEKKYEPLPIRMTLGCDALSRVFEELKYARPTLFVPASRIGDACQISRLMDVNVKLDASLEETEWYVEWNGRSVGSEPF